jgi:hypothetical protein
MNFADYFVKGLRNTLRLKKGVNWSVKGSEIPIPTDTEIDTWFVGEFSSAVYEVVAEYGKNDVEYVSVKVSARPEQASILVSGRNNNGRDLVNFSATVDASKVILTASPFYQDDGITPLTHVKLTFKVTYYERLTPTYIPTIDGESSSTGGELGTFQNWSNTNVPNGFMAVDGSGSIAISNIGMIQVPEQTELTPDFILTKLNIANIDTAVTLTTTSNSLTLSLENIANLVVTHSFTANTTNVSHFNNVNIGPTTAVSGKFTELTAVGAVSAISNNQIINLQPSGTGTIVVNPITTGTINNVEIGQSSAVSANFNALTVNNNGIFNANNQAITMSPTGTGTVNIAPATNIGSINNVIIGGTTPAAGRFTTITVLNPSTTGNQLITLSQLQAILLGAAV